MPSQGAKKRQCRFYVIGVSGKNALGWNQPHPELNKYTINGKLSKEGLSNNIPKIFNEYVGNALLFMTNTLLDIFIDSETSIFNNSERENIFASDIMHTLNVSGRNVFEGCQIMRNDHNILPHIDSENCRSEAYKYTGVMAIYINEKRCTIVTFTRNRACKYMMRLRHAKRLQAISK